MRNFKFFIGISALVAMSVFVSCEKDTEPTNFVPAFSTTDAVGVTRDQATVGGVVTVGTSIVKEQGILYSQYANMGVADTVKVASLNADGSFTVLLQNLQAGVKYYYCTYVSSGYSLAKADVKSFTTVATSTATFGNTVVSNVAATSFDVETTIEDEGGSAIVLRGFIYKEVPNATSTESFELGGVGVSDPVICKADEKNPKKFATSIKDLTPDKYYAVRPFATSYGTGYGEVKVVKTESTSVPALSSIVLSDTTETGVTISARILSEGTAAVTEYGFCYSSENKQPTTTNLTIPFTGTASDFNAKLTGLEYDKPYYIRAYAINANGTAYGEVKEYIAEYNPDIIYLATVESSDASNLSETQATLHGKILSNGGGTITRCGFCWSAEVKTPTVYNLSQEVQLNSTNEYSCTITNLAANVTYYYRFFAENETGISYSETRSFVAKTKDTPSVDDFEFPETGE